MQQVLHLLYLNHRTELKYPENKMMAVPHPHRKAYQPYNRRALEEEYKNIRRIGKSVQLPRKELDSPHRNSPRKRRLSRDEVETMQKYVRNYQPPQHHQEESNYIALPKISTRGNHVSRHGTERMKRVTHFRKEPIPVPVVEKRLSTAQRQKLGRRARRKFKRWVHAIIFVNRLRRKFEVKVYNFNKMLELSDSLLEIIDKMINKYYSEALEVPLLGFADNLRRKIESPQLDLTSDVVYNLVDISEGLKKSSIRKDLLKFLTLVTLNHARVPHDFFTEFELLRLDFSDKKFELVDMVELRVRMVVGIFLAIKMFCSYLINHPWDVELLEVRREDAKKMQPVIWAYSSYFYYATTGFFSKMPSHNKNFLKILKAKGVEPVEMKEQSDYFYDGVTLNFNKEMKQINSNLASWINRISSQVIRNRKNLQQK